MRQTLVFGAGIPNIACLWPWLVLALSQIYTHSYFWNNLREFDALFNQHDHSAQISSSIHGQTGFGPVFLHSPHHAALSLFFFALVPICTRLERGRRSLKGNTCYAGYLRTHWLSFLRKWILSNEICRESAKRDTRALDSFLEGCVQGNQQEAKAARKMVMRKLPARLPWKF